MCFLVGFTNLGGGGTAMLRPRLLKAETPIPRVKKGIIRIKSRSNASRLFSRSVKAFGLASYCSARQGSTTLAFACAYRTDTPQVFLFGVVACLKSPP